MAITGTSSSDSWMSYPGHWLRESYFFAKTCTIARYGYVWNVHRMSMKIEHKNLETRKTLDDFFVQVRSFLLPLSLKVLRHKEREVQSFYSDFFVCPPTLWHPPQRSLRASENQPSSPEAGLISTNWLFQNLPKSSAHIRCVTSFALAKPPLPISGYCDISEWHVRSARALEHLC